MYDRELIIAILDDHPMVLDGIQEIIRRNIANATVIGFPSIMQFNDFIRVKPVDLLLVDMFLSDGRGIDVCKEVKEKFPTVRVLGMSSALERSTIVELLQQGGSGFILKNTEASAILEAIEKVMRGEIVLSPEADNLLNRSVDNPSPLPTLTRRERELLRYLVQGKTIAEIADILFLSNSTIDTYCKYLLQKFKVSNTTELLTLVSRESIL
ncbi:response regulator [Sphingobacterium detergens]|uniref:LuxR family two component transcriptional regulator n=1 Tax=Sphingobacterium detergens TaxID=1145106 RepID=A0A420BI17_SPHD1|nr:response regulator transcription factor [Sphingobacterium detergens]RKE56317.1 LuxR family two component transcriptional regulator [Sphingobacterium detergens]